MSTKPKLQEDYVRQLFIGCEDQNCKNYFCRIDMSKPFIHKIAKSLSDYGQLFFCKNNITQNIIKLDPKRSRNHVLDFYLYVLTFNQNIFGFNKLEDEHIFCDFFKQNSFSDDDQILIEGVFGLLLRKYIDSDDAKLSNIIIRLFSEILLKVRLRKNVLINISDVFLNIDKLCRELKMKPKNETNIKCQKRRKYCQDCLFQNFFKENDLKNLIGRIRIYFNTKEAKTLRTSKNVEELLNVFHILFCINEKTKITSFRDFYLEDFCLSQNFKEEIKLNKSSYKTLIKYPFILPISLKSEYIKSENNDMMKNKLQDAFFRALFIGETSPYFYITVNRSNLYNDMFRLFMKVDDSEIMKEMKISFEGEEGVDSGGITKEFFQLISDNLVQDNFLFTIKNNVLWFSEEISTEKYEIIGKLVGIALYNDMILNIPFPTFLFKIFLNKQPELNDLNEIEPEICNSLKQMLEFSEEELGVLEQTFSITRNGKSIDLIPNGKYIPVNIHNRDTFVKRYAEYLMTIEMKTNIDGIKRGFLSVIRMSTINFLHPTELEKIIVGCSTIDIEKLKSVAIYSGFSQESWIIRSFWKIFEEYSVEDQKKLLMFITGNERVPVGKGENSKLIIIKNGCDTERLPSSQTCFNTILLPDYSSEEKLRKKLGLAISMTKGFFLL